MHFEKVICISVCDYSFYDGGFCVYDSCEEFQIELSEIVSIEYMESNVAGLLLVLVNKTVELEFDNDLIALYFSAILEKKLAPRCIAVMQHLFNCSSELADDILQAIAAIQKAHEATIRRSPEDSFFYN